MDKFYSFLKQENITDSDYKNVQEIWNAFNKNEKSIYLKYLVANNLYGQSTLQYSPIGGFKWINPKNIKDIKI